MLGEHLLAPRQTVTTAHADRFYITWHNMIRSVMRLRCPDVLLTKTQQSLRLESNGNPLYRR